MDLQKQLLKTPPLKSKEEMHEDLLINEVKQIFKDSENEDLALFNRIGFIHLQDGGEAIKKREQFVKAIKNLEPERIFTITQIKKICIKYRLRFLPSNRYRGTIDPVIPSKVREFESKVNYNGSPSYYIVAPKSSFKLDKKPVDPLMFAHLGNERYYLIHKWGNDLSVFRSVKYFPLRNVFCFLSASMTAVLLGIVVPFSFISNVPKFDLAFCTTLLLIPLIAIATELNFSNQVWDYKYKD